MNKAEETSSARSASSAMANGSNHPQSKDVFRTTADWLDNQGIPPILLVAVAVFTVVQLIIIAILLVRYVLQFKAQSEYDYENVGADQFLLEREKKKRGGQNGGKAPLKRQARRRSFSEPDLKATSELLAKPPTPSLRRHTPQPGTRVSGRKPRSSPISRRGMSLKEDETAASVKKREAFAGKKSQSTPQDLFRGSMDSPELERRGGAGQEVGADGGSTATPGTVAASTQFGKISFAVTYDEELEQVKVFVEQACQLAVNAAKHEADTFVKVFLTPEQGVPPSVSRIVRKTASPVYRHNFLFRVSPEAVGELVVKFQIFELDSFSRNDPIGELEYSLSQHRDFEIPIVIWKDLQAPPMVVNVSKGELLFSLTYLPNAEKVTLVVLKARNLRLPEWGKQNVGRDVIDTFVKVTLVKSGKVMKYKQTRLCRKSCHPAYNEGFALKVRQTNLDEVSITLAVCVRLNHLGFHRVIGRCIVGRHVGADGSSHWRDMIRNPRSGVSQWHALI